MTVASEIERIELAKSDIKYSIENKGITVPNSAKIDVYHNYIDQISASASGLATGITTYAKLLASGVQYGIQRGPFLSWNDSNGLYGLCTYAELPSGSESYGVTFFSKVGTGDIEHHAHTVGGSYTYNPVTEHLTAYKQGNLVRAFFTSWSTKATYCGFTSLRDMSNNSVTTTCVGSVDTLDPNAWGYDMTGWTEITGSTWVQDITTERNDSRGYMYLTLKLNSYPSPTPTITGENLYGGIMGLGRYDDVGGVDGCVSYATDNLVLIGYMGSRQGYDNENNKDVHFIRWKSGMAKKGADMTTLGDGNTTYSFYNKGLYITKENNGASYLFSAKACYLREGKWDYWFLQQIRYDVSSDTFTILNEQYQYVSSPYNDPWPNIVDDSMGLYSIGYETGGRSARAVYFNPIVS